MITRRAHKTPGNNQVETERYEKQDLFLSTNYARKKHWLDEG